MRVNLSGNLMEELSMIDSGIVAQILLVILLIIFGPVIGIWATNVLLCGHWVIPVTMKTWFAYLLLGGLLK